MLGLLLTGCAAHKPLAPANAPIVSDPCVRNVRCSGHWHVVRQKNGADKLFCDGVIQADLMCVPVK